MKRQINRDDLLEHIHTLQDEKINFEFFVNNHTYSVRSKLGTYFTTDNKIPFKELSFVQQVKNHIIKNGIHKKIKDDFGKNGINKIKYFDHSVPKSNVKYSNDLYEIDINQAYWSTALKLGMISQELYNKGLKIQKKTRLASLGSLAKKTKVYQFDGRVMKFKNEINQKGHTEHLWFKICQQLGNAMFKAKKSAKNNFIFYWVDGIYVRGLDAVVSVQDTFDKLGYEHKVREITCIEINKDKKELIVVDEIDGKRVFPFATPKFKKRRL